MQAIIANAVDAASAGHVDGRRSTATRKDYIELQTKDNVKFYKTPDAILKQQLEVYDEVVEEEVGGKSAVQGNPAIAARVRQADDAVGAGHGGEPQDGV